jgi:hypothetical protein
MKTWSFIKILQLSVINAISPVSLFFFKRPCFILLKAFKLLIKSKLPGEILFSISLMEYIRCIYEILHFTVKNLSNLNKNIHYSYGNGPISLLR